MFEFGKITSLMRPSSASSFSIDIKHKAYLSILVNSLFLTGAISAASFAVPAFAAVAEAKTIAFNVPAGALGDSLSFFARQSGITLTFDPTLVKGKTVGALKGEMTKEEGLHQLLKNTDLESVTEDGIIVIKRIPVSNNGGVLPEIVVTDSKGIPGELSKRYAGGQVAKGGSMGLLGNKGFMDTPFNQTNYTSKTIEDIQARSLSDVLIVDPSVRLSSARTNINEDFSIRGFAVTNSDVAINGMFGLAPFFRTPVESAERVEVLKGPSALLNGIPPSGNVGGNINLIPKRAGNDPLTRVTASYLSDSVFGGHVDIGRRFGENKEFGVRFNGAYRNGNTALDFQSLEESLGSLALDYRGERLRVSVDLMYQQQNIDRVTRQFSAGATLAKIPRAPDGRTNYPGFGYSNMKDRSEIIRGEYDVTDNVTVYGGYGTRSSRMDAVAGNPVLSNVNGNFEASPAWQLFNIDSRSFEAGVRGKFNTGNIGHTVSIGATRVVQDQSIFFFTAFPGRASNIYNPIYSSTPSTDSITANITRYASTTLTSYAIADTLSFLDDRIQLTLGARHQNVETPSYQFGTGAEIGKAYNESAVTPVAGVVVKPWHNVSLYANYIQGLSQGARAPVTDAVNPGKTYAPFKTEQKEVGVKIDWGRIATTVSLFEIERAVGTTFNNIFSVNGEQRNRGLEFNVFGEIVDHVRLLGGLAYTEGKLTKTAGGLLDGNYAVAVPKTQVNLGAEWDTLFVPNLTLTARTIYTSTQYVDQTNKLELPSWTRYDLGARYKTVLQNKPVTFRANVENVFDKKYWGSSNAGFLFLGAPRTLLLSATVDF